MKQLYFPLSYPIYNTHTYKQTQKIMPLDFLITISKKNEIDIL